ncbi:hypothetical protein [Natronobacterium gregoryi]|uniref:Uncharacterized protein n=2 Tax=Natronobacterium gregoryi TaxID=44930 RepID=L0AI03_NATGS|nr:hypothetical protein [Natronobacterium gregoryi]AFZ72670.1 hypothetical protein Natgr_1460 [Natronobacterium gregoryi SP2]ELY69040.1 hypothetical protein C490_08616 [Natronobacterium gregoryi SP2]PLK20625.1 hypothetical protein CYV19_08455 [Natronobacterium gregoryi SP2]SFI91092.1 hypothetical protein SAMN05443661_10951 [Natronobacterium gregoryi]
MRTHVDEIGWARLLERLCYLFPPAVGVGVVGVLQDLEYAVPGLRPALLIVAALGYTVLTLGVATVLFFDARRVRRQPGAGGNWRPRPWLNAVFALVWAPAAAVVYLARRHRRFGTPAGRSGWWLVVAASLSATVVGFAAATVAVLFAIPTLLTTGVGLAGAVAFGAFPIAIHQDAAYVCTQRSSWRPNPGVYLAFAFVSLFVPPLQPLLAVYYLYRRRQAIGTP